MVTGRIREPLGGGRYVASFRNRYWVVEAPPGWPRGKTFRARIVGEGEALRFRLVGGEGAAPPEVRDGPKTEIGSRVAAIAARAALEPRAVSESLSEAVGGGAPLEGVLAVLERALEGEGGAPLPPWERGSLEAEVAVVDGGLVIEARGGAYGAMTAEVLAREAPAAGADAVPGVVVTIRPRSAEGARALAARRGDLERALSRLFGPPVVLEGL